MSDPTIETPRPDFSRLGFVDAPLVPASTESGDSHWLRLVSNAAANRLLAACVRARAAKRPFVIRMTEEIPDYYYRVAQNNFLGVPGATSGQSTSDGYWLMLQPLVAGTHSIRFEAAMVSGPGKGFSQDVSYSPLTVR